MKRGFTILELLIVMGITMMVMGMVLVYRQSSQRQITLYIEAQKLAGVIFRAKSLAVSTYNNPDATAAAVAGFKICGYGVATDYSPSYSLISFQISSAGSCNAIGTGDDGSVNAISDTPKTRVVAISSYSLDPAIEFRALPDSRGVHAIYKIIFIPPVPKTVISFTGEGSISNPPAPGKFFLTTKDRSATAEISVNTFGQISF